MSVREISNAASGRGGPPERVPPGAGLRRLLELLRRWHEHARRRRELMEMQDHLLKDMGITREDVYRELRRPFRRP